MTLKRNIFDQYDEPENRLTHALACCLERHSWLKRSFILWAVGRRGLPTGSIEVLEQQVPGEPISVLDDDTPTGLPDLWLHDSQQWSLLVESKVAARVDARQLHRHLSTARRRGFAHSSLLVLAPAVPAHRLAHVVYRTWPALYRWLRRQANRSEWAECMADYMEAAEARMSKKEYLDDKTLTGFYGIPFDSDHPYNYFRAKSTLQLALYELRRRPDLRELGINPSALGRPAITGREGTSVWNFLRLREASDRQAFTSYPHLTLSIQSQRFLVSAVLPNAVPATMRRNLSGPGFDEFVALVAQVEAGVSRSIRRIRGAFPAMEVVQRHYSSQRANPLVDATLEFDLRTAVGSGNSAVRNQPQWLKAVHEALCEKRSNLQVSIGAMLPYGDPQLRSKQVLEVIAGVWVACKPWIDTILAQRGHRQRRRIMNQAGTDRRK